jgi:uncharacterized protein (DUF433 family)
VSRLRLSVAILIFTLIRQLRPEENSGKVKDDIYGGSTMITTTSWISKNPDRCGGDACIRDSRIPVWVLVGYRDFGKDDAWLLNAYPNLTPEDLATAWEYAVGHSDEIERAIRENEAGEEGFVE